MKLEYFLSVDILHSNKQTTLATANKSFLQCTIDSIPSDIHELQIIGWSGPAVNQDHRLSGLHVVLACMAKRHSKEHVAHASH
jgi:hypothetical protein